jgi:Immunoglobulin-like domain of bacterial spore germination/Sporulation and spore germination
VTDPRLDPHHDARMSELISDAVADIEPSEGLSAIRSRTRPDHRPDHQETTVSSSRNWLYAVGGAIAGTAAVIVAIAAVSQLGDDGDGSTPVAGPDNSQSSEPTKQPTEDDTGAATDTPTSTEPSGNPIEGAVPVYYVGDSGRGPVLFREFQPSIGGDAVAQAAFAAVAGPPRDADYRTLWPAGTEATASYDGDVITVDLTGPDAAALHDRAPGMSKREAELAVQQVVYSVQGAVSERAGVQFLIDGQRTDQVLGSPASEPLTNAPLSATVTLMNITQPEEGEVVSGETLTAEGVANAFEGTFQWEVLQGDQVVAEGFGTAEQGGQVDKLFAWTVDIDVSALAPGDYTLVTTNDDPSGGEGFAPDSDSKRFVIE